MDKNAVNSKLISNGARVLYVQVSMSIMFNSAARRLTAACSSEADKIVLLRSVSSSLCGYCQYKILVNYMITSVLL